MVMQSAAARMHRENRVRREKMSADASDLFSPNFPGFALVLSGEGEALPRFRAFYEMHIVATK